MSTFAASDKTDQLLPEDSRVRVAWLQPVVAHYRVAVANRLFTSRALDLTVYAGQELSGVGVPDASSSLEGRFVRLLNIRRPRPSRDPRVLHVFGWATIVAQRPEVVITTEASHNLANWLLLASRRRFGHRVVIMGHIRSSGQGRLAMWLRRRLASAADGVLAYTDDGVEQAATWGVPRSRVSALGNTLDLSRIESARQAVQSADVARVRKDLGLKGLVCLFVGRPNRVKRLDLAIDALRHLTERDVPAHLIVIGSSADLPTYVERASDAANIHFIGEVLDEQKLAPYFAVSDLMIIPGAVGLSVNHAFAYGLPLVTSADAPHRPEMRIAEHGRNTIQVRPMESVAFADALHRLAENPAMLHALKTGVSNTAVPGVEDMVAAIESFVVKIARQPTRDSRRQQ